MNSSSDGRKKYRESVESADADADARNRERKCRLVLTGFSTGTLIKIQKCKSLHSKLVYSVTLNLFCISCKKNNK